MRIIAGQNRGLTLAHLGKGDPGAHLRPTSDRVRESLFNLIGNLGQPNEATEVLDIFAGTGALALEALSRGARRATLIDNGRVAGSLIRDNIARCRRQDQCRVLNMDARRLPVTASASHDLVFLDPPYGQDLGAGALLSAQAGGWIKPGALICWEENTPVAPIAGFDLLEQRKYGDTWITLLRAPETVT